MDEFGCDYACRTVGEGMDKYNVAGDWRVEFDIYDGTYPLICISAEEMYERPGILTLRLRMIENEDEEYASCMVFPEEKRITFKIDRLLDLIKAMEL